MVRRIFSGAFFLALFSTVTLHAQKVNEPVHTDPTWSKYYQPFRIAGNLYYVGTYDLACYLITTPKGNILINTGLSSSAKMIKENIELLGFKFNDLKILLTTQAHYDHVGAMATIKKQTGAKMLIDSKDAAALGDGGSSDYAFGNDGPTFKSLKPDQLLNNGDTIKLGNANLVMLHHPGHTKGSCSFIVDVQDEYQTYRVLIANMPTIVTEKRFSDITLYPEVEKDYAYTFNAMKSLSFDIWLASHAGQFNLHAKHKPGDAYNPKAFSDRSGYDKSIADLEAQYIKKMKQP